MKKILHILLVLTFFGIWCKTDAQPREITFEAVETLMKKQQKPIVVFIHTSWCTYCKAMQATTFNAKKVVEKLNQDFYFIRLNAEEKRDIRFLNRVFKYKPSGPTTGVHELAQQLGSIDGKMAYPATVILNTDYEISFQHNAYLNVRDFLKLLHQFAL
ncbi:MAG: thioredoxin family protein [Bacteroidota bacterium]